MYFKYPSESLVTQTTYNSKIGKYQKKNSQNQRTKLFSEFFIRIFRRASFRSTKGNISEFPTFPHKNSRFSHLTEMNKRNRVNYQHIHLCFLIFSTGD